MASFRSLACALALLAAGIAHAQPVTPIAQDTLLVYLDQLTQWQREAAAVEPTANNARELVFRDSLRDNAAKVLRSGFTFLHSVADNEAATETVDPESTGQKLTQRAAQMRQRIAMLKARGASEELRLEQARYELVQTILANLNSASNKSPNKLAYTLDSLARSIPELSAEPAKTTKPAAATTTPKRTYSGILGLSASIFEVTRKQRELDDTIAHTTQLKKESMELMKTLRSGLGEPATAEDEDTEKTVVLSVDERVKAYQQLGAHIVPLGESMRWMDASKQTLKEWRAVLQQQRDDLLRQLAMRIGILIVALSIPLIISELVRRASKRINDPKRKRQMKTARRIITGVAVVVILMLNFISDFSSFATFAGFLTAGLAVALQSVLLSLVAHFLFYGRYGIRNGDRVHVNGVTGDIVQIGMVRFYLRELEETDAGLVPTGKTVAFPNSIVFQNVAFYKYA